MTMHLPGLRRTRPQLWGTVRWIRPLDGRQGGLSASISIGMDLGDMTHPHVARLTLDGIVESKFCWLLSAATAHGLDPGGGVGALNAKSPRGAGAMLRLEKGFAMRQIPSTGNRGSKRNTAPPPRG